MLRQSFSVSLLKSRQYFLVLFRRSPCVGCLKTWIFQRFSICLLISVIHRGTIKKYRESEDSRYFNLFSARHMKKVP